MRKTFDNRHSAVECGNRVGRGVTGPYLPHHRTFGSEYGGSRSMRESPVFLKKAHEPEV